MHMKTSSALALAAVALVVGFLAARSCAPQSSYQPPSKSPTSYDFGASQQLVSFLVYLHDTKQTNTLQRFNDYSNASIALREYADLGVTLAILKLVRDGRTNQAYEVLEGNLNADIVGFAASYNELPASLRDQTDLKILEGARDYRAKYPSPSHSQTEDEAVADAFKILGNK